MKKDLLLTAKEEQVKEAKKQGIISLVILLLVFVTLTISMGWEMWYRNTEFMLFAVGMCAAALALRPLLILSGAQRAIKERKQITEKGCCVWGKVIDISETAGIQAMSKRISVVHCVTVVYNDGNGIKKWHSPHYAKNPRDYIEVGKMYKLYILGKKCCLEAVEAKGKLS